MKVVLLATCRNPELLPATLLVFDTIRVGFPTATIEVHENGRPFYKESYDGLREACNKVGAKLIELDNPVRHDEWVQQMVWNERAPFVICDTDMIFFDKVEDWIFKEPWAGAFQPEYLDPYSKTIHLERFHTSLLFIRPDEVRDRVLRYDAELPKVPTFAQGVQLFRQQLQPRPGRIYFADTGASYYQALSGDRFSESQLDCFAHLHAGTWSDLLGMGLRELHKKVYADKELARGLWRKQAEFYAAHPPL